MKAKIMCVSIGTAALAFSLVLAALQGRVSGDLGIAVARAVGNALFLLAFSGVIPALFWAGSRVIRRPQPFPLTVWAILLAAAAFIESQGSGLMPS